MWNKKTIIHQYYYSHLLPLNITYIRWLTCKFIILYVQTFYFSYFLNENDKLLFHFFLLYWQIHPEHPQNNSVYQGINPFKQNEKLCKGICFHTLLPTFCVCLKFLVFVVYPFSYFLEACVHFSFHWSYWTYLFCSHVIRFFIFFFFVYWCITSYLLKYTHTNLTHVHIHTRVGSTHSIPISSGMMNLVLLIFAYNLKARSTMGLGRTGRTIIFDME